MSRTKKVKVMSIFGEGRVIWVLEAPLLKLLKRKDIEVLSTKVVTHVVSETDELRAMEAFLNHERYVPSTYNEYTAEIAYKTAGGSGKMELNNVRERRRKY